jgi:ubiquinone/menaquinone biosynthesis C-methylase UbiE
VSAVQRLLKRFCDSRWAWDLVQGPIYNRLIYGAASELYERLAREIQPPENARVLDVGSGPGFWSVEIARRHPTVSVIGIDYSSTQVRTANRLRAQNQIGNCAFLQGNAMALPFDDASFDVVVSAASLKHWPDGKRGLEEIRRVLVPDGLAFVGEADRDGPDEEILRFAKKFTAWYVWDPFMRWYTRRVVFGQSYTKDEAQSMATAAGFSDVSVEKAVDWPFFLMKLRKR